MTTLPPAVDIRAARPDDRESLQRLLALLGPDARVVTSEAPTSVAVLDGQVVGTVTLCTFTTLTGLKAYLDHLVVTPAVRRRGIGRDLVRHAIRQARACGASRVDLTARETKLAGRALYESEGFQRRDTSVFRLSL